VTVKARTATVRDLTVAVNGPRAWRPYGLMLGHGGRFWGRIGSIADVLPEQAKGAGWAGDEELDNTITRIAAIFIDSAAVTAGRSRPAPSA
jgi:hypothetical protein